MKNVLLLIHHDAGQEARLQAALDVTRALNGHLSCLEVVIMPAIAGDSIGFSRGAMLLDIEKGQESANRETLQRRLATEDVPWDWAEATGHLEPALKSACNLADLIVVNSKIVDLPLPDVRYVAGSLAVRSRKPVLAVPERASGFDAAGNALVLWNGSEAATAAMVAAIPLLRFAQSVTICEIVDGSGRSTAEEAAVYLSRHGIHAEVLQEKSDSKSAAEVLLEKANSGHYAFIVMGAYSKPRLFERLFGGVTRRLLHDSHAPLILAH